MIIRGNNRIFRKGELFCGPGGLALGAQLARTKDKDGNVYQVEHSWANDIDEFACETFRQNICKDNPDSVICDDVRNLDIESLPPIDAFAFGFPCNDFSLAGESKGLHGEYGGLYKYGVKVLDVHNPVWFIAENVGGLQSANDGQAFLIILKALENAGKYGYNLTPHLYKFEEYGIPQARHRIIIVGIRKDWNLNFKIPKAPYKNAPEKWKTSREALENPPIPEDAHNHEFTNHSKKVVEMLKYLGPGENAWSDNIPENLRLNVKGARMSNIYRRLDDKAPAYTVTGSGGGGTHMYHYSENRALTNRERARLQTFPDNFKFMGNKEQVRKQIGMAVPVDGAKIIVNAILDTFAGNQYEYEEPKWKDSVDVLIKKSALKRKKNNKNLNNRYLSEQMELQLY